MVTVCGCTTGPVLIIIEKMVGLYELENLNMLVGFSAALHVNVSLHVYSMSACSSF